VGQEEALSAEQGGLDAAGDSDVVVYRGLEGDQASGVQAEALAGTELSSDDGAAGVDEGQAVAANALEDETLTAEQAHADSLLKGDVDLHPAGGAEEGRLLAEHLAAEFADVQPVAPKVVRKSDSPVIIRLPASKSLPTIPCCLEGSPKTVCISMPWLMYIMAPASATMTSPGSRVISTNCMSSPKIS
jgi:hypothetical protein